MKLSDTQLMILSSVRNEPTMPRFCLQLNGNAANKVVNKLLNENSSCKSFAAKDDMTVLAARDDNRPLIADYQAALKRSGRRMSPRSRT